MVMNASEVKIIKHEVNSKFLISNHITFICNLYSFVKSTYVAYVFIHTNEGYMKVVNIKNV